MKLANRVGVTLHNENASPSFEHRHAKWTIHLVLAGFNITILSNISFQEDQYYPTPLAM